MIILTSILHIAAGLVITGGTLAVMWFVLMLIAATITAVGDLLNRIFE